ncbi:Arm DNA-binding domain-containing protein [Cognatilysobacter xinjiangensis]|nr:DUF3596 domain-containing protein [Lysobacter xinjiangensis]
MAKVRVRPETGHLYIDFSLRGVRCREQTALDDTPANRKAVEALARKIDKAIATGNFDYAAFFPNSPRAKRAAEAESALPPPSGSGQPVPTFSEAAQAWYRENLPRWRTSHAQTLQAIIEKRLLPHFGEQPLYTITRAEILDFRSRTQTSSGRKNKDDLSPSRVNHIMTALRMILADAADRYGIDSAFRNIKPLRVPKMDIQPFTLDEVGRITAAVRPDYRPYLVTRFFTGLRTGEINGLEWKHVDFDADVIRVRQSIVNGVLLDTKTEGSARDVPMVPTVRTALLEQKGLVPAGCRWVFPAPGGGPLSLVNFTNRVWIPLLRHLDLAPRRPYQTRHTAATLMLASGENPEWVARVLGHASTEMLFRVYSRYVPNLTRNDGRAFTGLVTGQGAESSMAVLPPSLAALSRAQLERLVRTLHQEAPHADA